MRRVLVLNHFAVPQGEPGGTRHAELFGALPGWRHTIIAARTNPSTRRRQGDRPGFQFVAVTPYHSNGPARILNWVSYAVTATITAMRGCRRKPDVMYASSPHLLTGLAGAVLAIAFRCPLVLEIRDLWPKVLVDMGQLSQESLVFRVLARLESWLYSRATRIVVLADGVATSLKDAGVPEAKIKVIPNAADPEFFTTEEPREEARRVYGFDRFTVVYTGAHGPANGLDLLLKAAAKLKRDDIHVVLVGDGVSKAQLVSEVAHAGLANVRFLPPVPKSEMPRLLLAADAGIHCLADVPLFRYGVSPNKIFDYMAAGKPVLTNTPGDVTSLVEQADAGLAVPPHGLAEGITALADAKPEQLAAWGSNGKRHMSQHQSRRAMARRLEELLDEVVPGRQK